VALPLAIGILMLLGWHLHLIAANKTTIEHSEVRPLPVTACARGAQKLSCGCLFVLPRVLLPQLLAVGWEPSTLTTLGV
jgi:hypothetical protein